MKYVLIALFFLSSGAVEASNDQRNYRHSVEFDQHFAARNSDWLGIIQAASVFTSSAPEVPFAEVRIEELLEGWHDAYLLNILQDENKAKALLRESMAPSKLNNNWWGLLDPFGQASILIGLLLLFSGTLYWSDNRLNKQIKRDKEKIV